MGSAFNGYCMQPNTNSQFGEDVFERDLSGHESSLKVNYGVFVASQVRAKDSVAEQHGGLSTHIQTSK